VLGLVAVFETKLTGEGTRISQSHVGSKEYDGTRPCFGKKAPGTNPRGFLSHGVAYRSFIHEKTVSSVTAVLCRLKKFPLFVRDCATP
jgi:hypothetical protein